MLLFDKIKNRHPLQGQYKIVRQESLFSQLIAVFIETNKPILFFTAGLARIFHENFRHGQITISKTNCCNKLEGFFEKTNRHEQMNEFDTNFMPKIFTLRASHLERFGCVAGRSQ